MSKKFNVWTGFTPAASSANPRTYLSKARDVVSVKDFGAAGDGSTDDRAAIQAALNTGKIVTLAGNTCGLGAQLTIPAGGGLVGPGAIVMLTGAGQFTNTSDASRFASNSCAIYALGVAGVLLSGFKISLGGSPSSDSVCIAIALRQSNKSIVNQLELTGFKKAKGIICVDTSNDVKIVNSDFHDCAANGATNGQLTGVNVDDNRLSSTASKRILISGNSFVNLTADSTFIAANGYQTDGVTIAHVDSGYHTIEGNLMDTLGEGVDCFGHHCAITGNTILAPYNYGVKLVHGAQYDSVIGNTIRNAGLVGIVAAALDTDTQNVSGHSIIGNVVDTIDPDGAWSANNGTACIATQNSNTTYKTSDILFSGNVLNPGANGKYCISSGGNGTNVNYLNNHLVQSGATAWAHKFSTETGSIIPATRTNLIAYLSSVQSMVDGVATKVEFDTVVVDARGEYDNATNFRWTCQVRGYYRVKFSIDFATLNTSGSAVTLTINKNLTATIKKQTRINGTTNHTFDIEAVIPFTHGDYMEAYCTQASGADEDATGSSVFTFLEIEQVS